MEKLIDFIFCTGIVVIEFIILLLIISIILIFFNKVLHINLIKNFIKLSKKIDKKLKNYYE